MAESPDRIRPYGDRRDDGVVQLSFVLPVPPSERARQAAIALCQALGFHGALVSCMERAAEGYSFFVVYGRTDKSVDFAAIRAPEIRTAKLGFDELNARMAERLGRRVVVVGACTGTDTHTVGIDAILNMKGYAGDYGLERYPMFQAFNLGSQVPNEELVRVAVEKNADAVLVSQVVTQRDVHKDNAREFVERAKAAQLTPRAILLLGGPRVDHALAIDLGFDAGFGPGTRPSEVANFLFHTLLLRLGKE